MIGKIKMVDRSGPGFKRDRSDLVCKDRRALNVVDIQILKSIQVRELIPGKGEHDAARVASVVDVTLPP